MRRQIVRKWANFLWYFPYFLPSGNYLYLKEVTQLMVKRPQGFQNIYLDTNLECKLSLLLKKIVCVFSTTLVNVLFFKEEVSLDFLRSLHLKCFQRNVPKWERSKNEYLQSVGDLALGVYSQAAYRNLRIFLCSIILENHINFHFNLQTDVPGKCIGLIIWLGSPFICEHVLTCISVYCCLRSMVLDGGWFFVCLVSRINRDPPQKKQPTEDLFMELFLSLGSLGCRVLSYLTMTFFKRRNSFSPSA